MEAGTAIDDSGQNGNGACLYCLTCTAHLQLTAGMKGPFLPSLPEPLYAWRQVKPSSAENSAKPPAWPLARGVV